MRSPLAKLDPGAMNAEELFAVKKRAWHEHHILVVCPDDAALSWEHREMVKQVGDMLYGKRKD